MSTQKISLCWLQEEFQLLRFDAHYPLPTLVYQMPMVTVSRTADELSLVLPVSIELGLDRASCKCGPSKLSALRVVGVLEHTLVGILAGLSGILADAAVPIFVVSTYDTDYIYVASEHKNSAHRALENAGYLFVD